MKVLYSLDSLNRGGAETQALDVIQNSKAFGFDSIVGANGSLICGSYEQLNLYLNEF